MSRTSPGPLSGTSRPRRNTTARSYSRRTLTLARNVPAMMSDDDCGEIDHAGPLVRFCEPHRLRVRRPSAPVTAIPRPCAAVVSGKCAGCARKSRSSQPPATTRQGQQGQQQRRLLGLVVAHALDDQDHRAQHDHHQRDPPMEAPGLRVGPRVERPNDLAAAVGVRARLLARAAVADMGLRAVANEPALVVELVRPQVLALGALPVIERLVIGEARRAVAQRAPMRVGREPLENERPEREQGRVSRRQQDLGVHVTFAAAASASPSASTPAGCSITVNRMSSGSSRVTRLTVWRIPR